MPLCLRQFILLLLPVAYLRLQMDAVDLRLAKASVDLVLDKGTLDAILSAATSDDPSAAEENYRKGLRALSEVKR